jgi:dihydroneopterin aldolase
MEGWIDRIFISGLEVRCVIGILPEERTREQKLVVDATMGCGISEAARTGDVSRTIDYAAVSDFIAGYCRKRKAGLLEELGEELCAKIMERFGAAYVAMRLVKPEAVPGARGGTGIELARGELPKLGSPFAGR